MRRTRPEAVTGCACRKSRSLDPSLSEILSQMTTRTACSISLIAALSISATALAEEGMWTFDNPPVKQLKEKYNFKPTQE